jgi:hypothetical protein
MAAVAPARTLEATYAAFNARDVAHAAACRDFYS